MEIFHRNRRRGAALMLSLWALFLLSAMVISWALQVGSSLTMSGNASRSLEAQALACSGVEIAQHPDTRPGSPALVGGFGRNQTFEARITGEGGRINLKWVIQGEDPVKLEVLRKFLEIKGVELNERDRMIDTLLDWVDPDNAVRLNGAEEEAGYRAPNKMITRIDELKKIMGWDEFTSAEDWDSDFTLDSQPPINLAWASRDVLLALPGTDEMRVDQFLAMRPGPDGIDGNDDDTFAPGQTQTPPDEALAVLGITPQARTLVSFIKNDPVQRIVSVGESGTATRTVEAVFNKTPGSLTQKSWKEF